MTTTPTSGAADLPEALRSIQRFEVVDCIDEKHVPAVIPKPHGPWVRYEDHIAALAAGQATAAKGVAYAALPDEREAFESWLRSVWTAGYGCPKFDSGKYVHGEAQRFWECWQARTSHGQAPAGATLPDGWVPLTITHEGQHPEEVAYGPQIMMDRLGKWLGKYFAQAAQAADSVTAPAPPPECETESEKRAFAFGWFKALESERMKADSVLEDAARWRELREQHESDEDLCCVFAPNDMRECLVPVGSLPGELDAFMDSERAARKQGETK